MAGRHSPRHADQRAENQQRHRATQVARQQEIRERAALAREAQLEEAQAQRQARRLALAAPLPYRGGPESKYTDKIAKEICERLIKGETLMEMCRENEHLPCYATILKWLHTKEDFREEYAVALELSAHYEADSVSATKRAALEGVIESDVARVAIQAAQLLASWRNKRLYSNKNENGQANSDIPPVVNLTLQRIEQK